MNDAEIIKALEYCINNTVCLENCEKCPYKEQGNDCMNEMLKDCLNLIKSQQAEIEELKLENRVLSQNRITMPERLEIVNNAKDKAIREFAEKLKDVFVTVDGTFECSEVEEHIDNLVKEMTGGEDNDT